MSSDQSYLSVAASSGTNSSRKRRKTAENVRAIHSPGSFHQIIHSLKNERSEFFSGYLRFTLDGARSLY